MPTPTLGFRPLAVSNADALIVPDGYRAEVLVAWGDPISNVANTFANRAAMEARTGR